MKYKLWYSSVTIQKNELNEDLMTLENAHYIDKLKVHKTKNNYKNIHQNTDYYIWGMGL